MLRSVRKPGLVPVVEPEVLMDGDHTLSDATRSRKNCYERFFISSTPNE